ncbi:MAG: hypothetical protein GKR89_22185 [Candidatus Latescibacteria bacterium]|nr:hypothetical protein [Candidatus Latescibacterota bacterium]
MPPFHQASIDIGALAVTENGLLVTRAVGGLVQDALCARLETLPPPAVLHLDFAAVRYMDVSCADEAVVHLQDRLQAGAFPDRFIVLANLAAQHRENIAAALTVAHQTVLVQQQTNGVLLGPLADKYRTAFDAVVDAGATTARQLQKTMAYSTINEASTKLTALYQRRLIGREPFRQAVRGGGRQFRYLSLLD